MISSAAGFIATRSTVSGSCRISKRCFTTRRNWPCAYLDAYQITGDLRYEAIARDMLDYVRRDLTDAGGGFYSAEDADSLTSAGGSRKSRRRVLCLDEEGNR